MVPTVIYVAAAALILAAVAVYVVVKKKGEPEENKLPVTTTAPAGTSVAAKAAEDPVTKLKSPAEKEPVNRELLPFMQNYYRDLSGDHFVAENYFSDNIIQYIGLKNTNPAAINRVYATNKEYLNASSSIINNEITPVREEGGISYHTYWIDFSCYRSSLNKQQRCKVKIELGLDEAGKITVYREQQVRDLIFSNPD